MEQLGQQQERINKRSGRNLLLAVLIGLVLGAVFMVAILFAKPVFIGFLSIVAIFGAYELANALRSVQRDVPRIASIIGVVSQIVGAYLYGPVGQLVVLGAALLLVMLWRVVELLRPSHRTGLRNLLLDFGVGNLIQVYIGFLASFCALLLREDGGEWWVMAFVITVVVVDTGAYATGVLWGKTKFVPKISPSKTWEGFLGASAAGMLSGVLFGIFLLEIPWWGGLIFGAALVFSATLGDLTESIIKRDLGVKDMSSWLPGHGGFMDRLDSMLPSCLTAFLVFLLFHMGQVI